MKKRKEKQLEVLFGGVVGLMTMMMAAIFVPGVQEILRGEMFLVILGGILVLSAVLLWQVRRSKTKGKMKRYYWLTGGGALGFAGCAVLHNFFYALAVVAEEMVIVRYVMEALQAGFFLVGVLVCPIVALVGAVGGVVGLLKRK